MADEKKNNVIDVEPSEKQEKEDEKNKKASANEDFSKDFKEGVEESKKFTSWLEGQSMVLKLVLALPVLDIIWGIYRIFKALQANDPVRIIIAILLIIPGTTVTWILDIIWILTQGNGFWF